MTHVSPARLARFFTRTERGHEIAKGIRDACIFARHNVAQDPPSGRGQEAAAEFQKVLNHRGIVLADPIGALAHLQLGRAYVVAGDFTKAKSAYHDFLNLWKDADPDTPVLKQAVAEYGKL